jgi:CRP-like cAMP-binding protein
MKALNSEVITGNVLLDDMPAKERSKLSLVDVPLSVGQVLCDCGQKISCAYFPIDCVISREHITRNGTTAETALIGKDGMFDVAVFLAGGTSSSRAVVHVAGHAFRVPARALQDAFNHAEVVQHVLLRYTNTLLTQISQTAICNRLHPLEQRLCRWLLLCNDRLGRDELPVTQEIIANILGGRRESITVVAGRLQDRGAIRYSRGHVKIVNRELLEQLACECYEVGKTQLARTEESWNFTSDKRQTNNVASWLKSSDPAA